MAYVLCKTLQSPTIVDSCVTCFLCTENEPNLVLAKASLLQVYAIKAKRVSETDQTTYSLELLLEKKLNGNIVSMAAVRFPGKKLDSMCLTFQSAKVTRVEFDPATNDLKTVALHFFEDPILKEGRIQFHSLPFLKVDPKQRCGALLFYDTKLAIIPFKEETEDFEDFLDGNEKGISKQSYVINLTSLGIKNVRDYAFLGGFFEPTLLILYEPVPSWAGRIDVLKDTCCLAALSISTRQRTNPVVWQKDKLSFECERLIPVPDPLGGVLVVCPSHIYYFNQSYSYCLVLNSFHGYVTDFQPAMEYSGIQMSFDATKSTFLEPDKLLFSLKNGELYLLHILSESKVFKGMHIDRVGSSVLTSCMCKITSNLAFFGSRLGDSLLMHYKAVSSQLKEEARKQEDMESIGAKSQYSMLDQEEEQIYFKSGSAQKKNTHPVALAKYEFQVMDSLINVGPIVDMTRTDSWDSVSLSHNNFPEFLNRKDKTEKELRTCSGYTKNGSICVLQQSLRPELLFALEIAGIVGMWSLYCSDTDSSFHNIMIVSRESSTMVLQLGEGLNEITEPVAQDFHVTGPTIEAGNVLQKHILQVYSSGIVLLKGKKKLLEEKFDEEIIHASIVGSFVMIQFISKKIEIFQIVDEKTLHQVSCPMYSEASPITACTLFEDTKSFFSRKPTPKQQQSNIKIETPNSSTTAAPSKPKPVQPEIMDDEDMLLYGGTSDTTTASTTTSVVPEIPSLKMEETIETPTSDVRVFCFIVRENGRFEIYQLPVFNLIFSAIHFNCNPALLLHTDAVDIPVPIVKKETTNQGFFAQEKMTVATEPIIVEIEVKYLENCMEPVVVALNNFGDLLIFKAFSHFEGKFGPFQFSRFEHEHVSRNTKSTLRKRLKKFSGVGEKADKEGIFVCGPRPVMLMSERSYPRLINLDISGEISAFTPFNDVNAPGGILYSNPQGVVQIAQLSPEQGTFLGSFFAKKIQFRVTTHKIVYFPEMKLIAVVVSHKVPRKMMEVEEEEDKQQSLQHILHRDQIVKIKSPVQLYDDRYELRLLEEGTWETVDKYEFQEFEHVLSMRICDLKSNEDQRQNLKQYLVIGTGNMVGEDITCKGRVIIFEVLPPESQYYDPDKDEKPKPKLKTTYSKEQKGPISAVCSVCGYLLLCIGPKLVLYNFSTGTDLIGLAFYDAQIFIVSLTAVKNYILFGDVYKGVSFLRWREDTKQLILLAKDYNKLPNISCEFLISGQHLEILAVDNAKNVQVFNYAPEGLESRGGQMLVPKLDFHVGTQIEKFLRIQLESKNRKVTTGAFFASVDGSLGVFAPVEEPIFRRLVALQNKMVYSIPHFGGLNPKQFRNPHLCQKIPRNIHPNLLDGELLWRFISLDFYEQRKLAKQIGTTIEQIMDNLQEFANSARFF